MRDLKKSSICVSSVLQKEYNKHAFCSLSRLWKSFGIVLAKSHGTMSENWDVLDTFLESCKRKRWPILLLSSRKSSTIYFRTKYYYSLVNLSHILQANDLRLSINVNKGTLLTTRLSSQHNSFSVATASKIVSNRRFPNDEVPTNWRNLDEQYQSRPCFSNSRVPHPWSNLKQLKKIFMISSHVRRNSRQLGTGTWRWFLSST